MILVMGGSGSGKSAYAEELLTQYGDTHRLYYLATMQIYGKEEQKKVERHRRMRQGKGFKTIEQPCSIIRAIEKIEKGSAVLLECMSNLTANEMFSENFCRTAKETAEKIITEIQCLKKHAGVFIIVTNNVFEDGIVYEEATKAYQEALGQINEALAVEASEVIEVTAGIPVCHFRDEKKHISVNQEINTEENVKKGKGSMEFYFGGICQGKLQYVKDIYEKEEYRVWEAKSLLLESAQLQKQLDKEDKIIINHYHHFIKKCLCANKDPYELTELLLSKKKHLVIICDEIGNGIVPVDSLEREYRECTGRIQCELAKRAERVERILCGIGQRLK